MTTRLTAVFDDRDGADLALLRLRRNNIDFSIAELKAPRREAESSVAKVAPIYGLPAPSAVSASEMYSAVLGSRAVKQRSASGSGKAQLTINVNSDQALHARAILCSVKGRIL